MQGDPTKEQLLIIPGLSSKAVSSLNYQARIHEKATYSDEAYSM
jgi:hypothetical protein